MGNFIIKTPTYSSKNIENFNINFTTREILLEISFSQPHFTKNIEKYKQNPQKFSIISVIKRGSNSNWDLMDNDISLLEQQVNTEEDDVIIFLSALTGITRGKKNSVINFNEKELIQLFTQIAQNPNFSNSHPVKLNNLLIHWTPSHSKRDGASWKWKFVKGDKSFPSGLPIDKEKELYNLARTTPVFNENSHEKSNIFSLAACIYSLSFWNSGGVPPIYDFGTSSKFGNPVPPIEGYSSTFNDFILNCLDRKSNNRPSVEEAINILTTISPTGSRWV